MRMYNRITERPNRSFTLMRDDLTLSNATQNSTKSLNRLQQKKMSAPSVALRGWLPHVSHARPVFLCCDIQSNFRRVLPNFGQSAFVARRFLQYHELQREHTMFLATEQVPDKLGKLDPAIGVPELVHGKSLFSMITPEVEKLIQDRSNFILFGIEAHVCCFQTAEALLLRGKNVWIAADGTWSQRDTDRDAAFAIMRDAGVTISTSESILLQLTRDAADPKFKAVSALLKQQMMPPAAAQQPEGK